MTKFKTSSTKTPVHHRRSRSVKADLMRNKEKYILDDNCEVKKDDLELEHFVARNSQRMSLRLQSKRRPAENMLPFSPAVKRRAMLSDMTNAQGISHPRLVSASTQMFTTPIKPLMPSKPLNQMVKPGHSRILLSNETELVKVVDTRSYVPSPGNENVSPGVMSPGDSEVFCSSSTVNIDKHRDTHTPRRRVRRRHSSGATTCFSSSPRTRYQGSSKTTISKELDQGKQDNQQCHSPTIVASSDSLDISHISVAARALEHTPPARVKYSGAALLKPSNDLTPCKFHRATPPATLYNTELKEVLSQKI